MDKFLNVTYQSVSSDNLAAYLEAMGVEEALKAQFQNAPIAITLKKSGNKFIEKTSCPPLETENTFVDGEEYDHKGLDGRSYRCLTRVDGNKLVTNIMGDHPSTVIGEYSPDKLVLTLTAAGVQAQHIFARV